MPRAGPRWPARHPPAQAARSCRDVAPGATGRLGDIRRVTRVQAIAARLPRPCPRSARRAGSTASLSPSAAHLTRLVRARCRSAESDCPCRATLCVICCIRPQPPSPMGAVCHYPHSIHKAEPTMSDQSPDADLGKGRTAPGGHGVSGLVVPPMPRRRPRMVPVIDPAWWRRRSETAECHRNGATCSSARDDQALATTSVASSVMHHPPDDDREPPRRSSARGPGRVSCQAVRGATDGKHTPRPGPLLAGGRDQLAAGGRRDLFRATGASARTFLTTPWSTNRTHDRGGPGGPGRTPR